MKYYVKIILSYKMDGGNLMMPVLFVGHGSPMNAIESNKFTKGWQEIATSIPIPTAILSISAHWLTDGTHVSTVENPNTIHDFYGFPQTLFSVKYNAKGCPLLAQETIDLLGGIAVADNSWGLDHGTWSVLRVMYPNANIPVYQLSINTQATPKELFEIGRKLKPLRERNVLILASGNVVHNLGVLDFSVNGGFDWANNFDDFIENKIKNRDFEDIFKYRELGDIARYSVPTTDHFHPLFYILGATESTDKISVFNKSCMAGSLSMTSYMFT